VKMRSLLPQNDEDRGENPEPSDPWLLLLASFAVSTPALRLGCSDQRSCASKRGLAVPAEPLPCVIFLGYVKVEGPGGDRSSLLTLCQGPNGAGAAPPPHPGAAPVADRLADGLTTQAPRRCDAPRKRLQPARRARQCAEQVHSVQQDPQVIHNQSLDNTSCTAHDSGMTYATTPAFRAELLPNGFCRVRHYSGLVRLYEVRLGGVSIRSGNGCPSDAELEAVRAILHP
jgi:hypothetical protein